MAKTKPNKRIQKKQSKKELTSELRKYGYTESQTKNKTISELSKIANKESRNYKQRQRRASNLAKWEALGIDKKIISQFDLRNKNPEKLSNAVLKEIKNKSRAEKARQTREINRQHRYNQLIAFGYTPAEIKPIWLTSDNRMYEAMHKVNPLKVFHADNYIALAFTPAEGVTAIFNTSKYKNWSFEEILQAIVDRYAECMKEIDGTGQMSLFFKIESGDYNHCEEMLYDWGQRGYNLKIGKLTDRRYYRMVNRNDWNMREYAEMMLCIMEQSKNADVPHLVDAFEHYAFENHLPFNEIFDRINHLR